MSWLRLDDDYASDGTIRRCRAVAWWPLILCAMKRGGGVASDDDLSGEVLADIGQGDAEAAERAVDRLKAAGRIVAADGGWTVPEWNELQRDATSTDRVRRMRERRKQDETACNVSPVSMERDVTVKRPTGQDMTLQDGTCSSGGGSDPSRARVEPAVLPPTPPPDGLQMVTEAFRATQSGRSALMLSPATVTVLAAMVKDHGAVVVVEAIRRASEKCQGDLTVAYLRPVVAAVAKGEPEQRQKPQREGEYQPGVYKSKNGVATPPHCAEDEF